MSEEEQSPTVNADTCTVVSEIAEMLVMGWTDPPIAQASNLDLPKLDYSIESLVEIDAYLLEVHRSYRKWHVSGKMQPNDFEEDTELGAKEALKSTVIRCGAYAGEVIRRNGRPDLQWSSYADWAASYPEHLDVVGHDISLGTAFILNTDAGETWFPLEKILKYLEAGPADSVVAFAKVVMQPLQSNK
ncbi:MAG: hypothetical protein ACRDBH_01415 [Bosea sp. (in: a-proteobacteria)]